MNGRRSSSRSSSSWAVCSVSLLSFALGTIVMEKDASAQELVERLRLQGGFISVQTPPVFPQTVPPTPNRTEDWWVGAVPELIVAYSRPRSVVTVSYALTAALHTLASASEVANRLGIAGAYELSPRTGLLLSADGSQTSVSNFLIQQSPTDANIALYPSAGTRILTGHLSQALRHELSPVWLASQESSASVTTTLAPAPPLDTFVAGVGTGLERLWLNDGVGVHLRGGYAKTVATPPTPDVEIFTATLAPSWRRDWSRSVNTNISAGVTYLTSPDPLLQKTLAPFAQATVLYTPTPLTTFTLSYNAGIFPSPLTGQILQSQHASLHGTTPISEHHRIFISGSVGYLRGELVGSAGIAGQTYDAAFDDVDITWQATNYMQVFGRYQFIVQLGQDDTGINNSFIRDAVIVGVQFSSASAMVSTPTRFAQRVDGADAPVRPAVNDRPNNVEFVNPENEIATEPEHTPDDETTSSGGSVEGMPGMWRTRPSQPRNPPPNNAPTPNDNRNRNNNNNNNRNVAPWR